jgi:hypothetical protein
MQTATIRIQAVSKRNIRTVVFGDDRSGRIAKILSSWATQFLQKFLIVRKMLIIRFAVHGQKTVGRILRGSAANWSSLIRTLRCHVTVTIAKPASLLKNTTPPSYPPVTARNTRNSR